MKDGKMNEYKYRICVSGFTSARNNTLTAGGPSKLVHNVRSSPSSPSPRMNLKHILIQCAYSSAERRAWAAASCSWRKLSVDSICRLVADVYTHFIFNKQIHTYTQLSCAHLHRRRQLGQREGSCVSGHDARYSQSHLDMLGKEVFHIRRFFHYEL